MKQWKHDSAAEYSQVDKTVEALTSNREGETQTENRVIFMSYRIEE